MLRRKARWYLSHGVEIVWVLFPEDRRAVVLTPAGEDRVGTGERMPPYPALPELAPALDDLFAQIDGR